MGPARGARTDRHCRNEGRGGIGAGGYILGESLTNNPIEYVPPAASFAWQAGGGVTYAFNPRVTLDLGYRFFSLSPGLANIYTTNDSGTLHDTVGLAGFANGRDGRLKVFAVMVNNWSTKYPVLKVRQSVDQIPATATGCF